MVDWKEASSPDGATGIIKWSDLEWQLSLPANSLEGGRLMAMTT